jgi:hypothetical protein
MFKDLDVQLVVVILIKHGGLPDSGRGKTSAHAI